MPGTLKGKILDEFDKIYNELLNINNSEESTEFKERWLQDFLRGRRKDIEFYLDSTWHRVEDELPKEYRPVLLCYKNERNHKFTKIATYAGMVHGKPRWMTSGSHVLIILDKCTEVCWAEIPAPPNDNFFVKGGGNL